MAIHGYGADVEKATDARSTASGDKVAGAIDDLVAKVAPGAPIADAGGTVIYNFGIRDGAGQGSRIAQIALNELHAKALQKGAVARGPHQGADAFAARDQLLDNVAAEKPRRTSHYIELVRHAASLAER